MSIAPVLITGANGFVGSAFMDFYGPRARGLTRAQCDYSIDGLKATIGTTAPETILHCAGSASVAHSIEDPEGDYEAQVGLATRLMEAAYQSDTSPRVILFSSAAVYGNPVQLPVREDAALVPLSPYGVHKVMLEKAAQKYAALGLKVMVVRIFSLFGARQKRLLIHELFKQFNDPAVPDVVLMGTGDETRDYLSIEAFTDAVARLDTNWPDDAYSCFNVASGQRISAMQCAQVLKTIMHSHKPIRTLGQIMEGVPTHWCADISRFKAQTGFDMPFDFDGALAQVVTQWTR